MRTKARDYEKAANFALDCGATLKALENALRAREAWYMIGDEPRALRLERVIYGLSLELQKELQANQ